MSSDPPAPIPDASQPSAAHDRPLPVKIGARYVVIEQLGRGGMAVVYRVRDGASGPERALKQLTLHGQSSRDRETKALFEREFSTLAQLSHPSVIAVYDYGIAEDGPYYTMELLDGGDLSTRAPLPYRDACAIMIQVCSSLSLLHARRLLHRDISPRNVRCTLAGTAKLIDFGAMVPLGTSGPSVGTPAFIAPEVVHHLALDARADLFSLGATLYFALTGRPPYAVRAFSELRDAWSQEPPVPSQIVAGIPPALDALVLSLLSIDPARRPRSAFEVMQRLAAIAGSAPATSVEISRAYLSTPTLVARDAEQHRVRARIRRAIMGQGGALAIEAEAGVGRSRLLDACILDAKTLGATVLRLAGRNATGRTFEAVQSLGEQLLEALPELAERCARDPGAPELIAAAADGGAPKLKPLADIPGERELLQAALTGWVSRVCRERPLVMAMDDVEQIDEPSLGWLAGLALAAAELKLMILVTREMPVTPGAKPALDVLRTHCTGLEIKPFDRQDTERFFAALFGEVSQVALVADRIYKIAAGNARESMALAQYMLDKELIRYADGQWILPAELALADLPANAHEALRARVAALPEFARRLVEAQALSLAYQSAWTRADYAEFAPLADAAEIDGALSRLVSQGVLVADGNVYTLAHHAMRMCLLEQLSAAERAERHVALAELCIRKFGREELLLVHHWLEGGLHTQALDLLAELTATFGDRVDWEIARMEVKDMASVLERAIPLILSTGRRRREAFEYAQHLLALAVLIDNAMYDRYAPTVLAQLEQDSGLQDYRSCPETMPAQERLQTALTQAMVRYNAAPEYERIYRVDEAIKLFARFATVSIVIGVRTRDSRLLASLPGMLEPFAGLSPVLHALWQNLISATEMNYAARSLDARERALSVYEGLANCTGEDLRYVDMIRYAVCYALSVIEVSLGYTTANTWIEKLDQDRMQHVNAMRLRSFQSLYEGDVEQAERHRTRAEILAVQSSSRQMFDSPIIVELSANLHASDLSGVKRVADRIAGRAANEPRWRGASFLAEGFYQRLRGDHAAAHEAFQQSIALDNPSHVDPPPWLDTWRAAAAGDIAALVELGRAAEARSFGERVLEQALERGLGPAHDIVRELALAQAKTGDFARASERLDTLIAERAGIEPAHLAADYEARACVAIWAKDTTAAAHFADLAVRHDRLGRHATLLVRQSRLLDEARGAGMDVGMLPTNFESSILGDTLGPARRAVQSKVTAALEGKTPADRAQCALRLLCEAAKTTAGHLYLLRQGDQLERAATLQTSPEPALDVFAREYWMGQVEAASDGGVTQSGSDATELAVMSWTHPSGAEYQLLVLKCMADQAMRYIGLVALRVGDEHAWPPVYWELASAVSQRLLELGDVKGVELD